MMIPIQITDVSITDPFWSTRIETARNTSINYMWNALNDNIPDVPPSYSIQNMKIAAGLSVGEYHGRPFQDSDLYKWIESASYSLATSPDADLLEKVESVISVIEKAQAPDGYINTYIMLTGTPRWSNLASFHELYCGGHMMEAAVAFYHATGQKSLLNVACKFADLVNSVFGLGEGKIPGYPGHQEIEIGLFKLYKTTGDKKYLDLAKYFLDERGQKPFYYDHEQEERIHRGEPPLDYFQNHGPMRFSYQQAHRPVREQKIAVGHAVREVYMCSAMADIGRECDPTLLDAADTLYWNIVHTQMYLIGAIGSMVDGEALSLPYDLPNDCMYTETCASIGLMMLSQRLMNCRQAAQYGDVIERALYNTVLASVSEDGTKYFYCNPMEMWPERNRGRNDVKDIFPERQGWYVCACCPPNILRTLLSLAQYIYSVQSDGIAVILYIGSTARFQAFHKEFTLEQNSYYTNNGKVIFTIHTDGHGRAVLKFRIPEWNQGYSVSLNGEPVDASDILQDGFLVLDRDFQDGDSVELCFPLKPVFVYADDRVPYDAGKVALQRGPFIYCSEETDNGKELWNLSVDTAHAISEDSALHLSCGLPAYQVAGKRRTNRPCSGALYTYNRPVQEDQIIRLVPYFYWGNRKPAEEMMVWHPYC